MPKAGSIGHSANTLKPVYYLLDPVINPWHVKCYAPYSQNNKTYPLQLAYNFQGIRPSRDRVVYLLLEYCKYIAIAVEMNQERIVNCGVLVAGNKGHMDGPRHGSLTHQSDSIMSSIIISNKTSNGNCH
jgi:hypothetical protein